MPTWVVILINGVLFAYCVVMLVIGRINKKKKIAKAKENLKKEFAENEQRETTKEAE